MTKTIFCAATLLLGSLTNPLQARPFAPMDVFNLEWAEQPEFSPDGQEIVFVRMGLDVNNDQRRSAIWRVRLRDGALRPLLSEGNPGVPRYAPDGKSLAYLQGGKLMLRWLDSGESVSLAQLPEGAEDFAFSPDSKHIAFAMLVTREPAAGVKLPTAPKGANWGEPVKVIDRLIHRADGAGDLALGEHQLFVVPVQGGNARQVSSGHFEHHGFAWRADSKALFVSSNRRADAEYTPLNTELYELDLASGNYRALSNRDGPDDVLDAAANGRYLAYSGFDDRQQFHQGSKLYLLDLQTNKTSVLAADLDRDIASAKFSADSQSIYLQYDDHGVSKVGRVSIKDNKFSTLVSHIGGADIGRPYGSGGFAVDAKGRIAFSNGANNKPAELALLTGNTVRNLTDLNSDALADIEVGQVEEITVPSSFDKKPIQGWIVYPPNFDRRKKYPLLLEIHGGPVANYGPRFSPELQLYAAAGNVVLYGNPRGSDSYGEAFANAIHHDYPNHDYDDLMSLVDGTIAKGFIDDQRLYVTGGSGGGVLTAWIVGHTNRFKAAVVAKPVINWMSFALTSDGLSTYYRYWFEGFPWDHSESYLRRSPLMVVGKVQTPTMVIVGSADLRTPVAEAEQYYHALKLRKIPTKLLLVPGAGHSISARPSHMIAQVLNTQAWFDQYGNQKK